MTIITPTHSVTTSFATGYYMRASAFKVSRKVRLNAIGVYVNSGAVNQTMDVRAYIWDANGNNLASSARSSLIMNGVNSPAWVALTTPVVLEPNTVYFQGVYSARPSYENSGTTHNEPTVDNITVSSAVQPTGDKTAYSYYGTSDPGTSVAWPNFSNTITSPYEFPVAYDFSEPNNPPTISNVFPDKKATGAVGSTVRFTWTYSDIESNPQTQYELSYRVKGSSSAFTVITQNSSNAYHDFAPNTFTDGQEYEWTLKVSDAFGSSNLFSSEFTGGTSVWSYGASVTGAASSGFIPTTFFFDGFEAARPLDNWESNTFFGTYVQATLAQTTTVVKSGTSALEVNWPTGTESRANINKPITGLVIGNWYVMTADVRVPSGSPDVEVDPFLQANAVNPVVTEKNAWVTRSVLFQATTTSVTLAVKTKNQSPVSGQKLYIDNVSLTNAPLDIGNYEVQVRTSDIAGFGPWSNSSEFKVNPLSNVYIRSNGQWIIAKNNTRIAGAFKQVLPTKKNTGGLFS